MCPGTFRDLDLPRRLDMCDVCVVCSLTTEERGLTGTTLGNGDMVVSKFGAFGNQFPLQYALEVSRAEASVLVIRQQQDYIWPRRTFGGCMQGEVCQQRKQIGSHIYHFRAVSSSNDR